jgi:NADPH2:quinone reductase
MIAALPTTMKAAVVNAAGPPESVHIADVPIPKLKRDHVIIAVDFASVGSWDAKIRAGAWGPVERGTILGSDGAGTIAAIGGGVDEFHPGDRVYAYDYGVGFHAQYVSVPAMRAEHVGPVPRQLSEEVAGAIPCVALTALAGLAKLGDPQGKRLLVFGASGGVGSLAVWLGNRTGATIVGSARTDAHAYVRNLGAVDVVDPGSPHLDREIERATRGGLDGALVTANGPALPAFLKHLKNGAPIVYPDGVEPEPAYEKHPSIAFDADTSRGAFQRLNAAIGSETIPVKVTTYALEDAVEAHRRIEQGHVVGKLVLRIR